MYLRIHNFHKPTHYIDITAIEEEKRKLIRFHEDQSEQEEINLSLNAFRAAQLIKHKEIRFAEAFFKVDVNKFPEAPDLLLKLYCIHEDPEVFKVLAEQGIEIKRVMPMNISMVYEFIRDNFAKSWADESLPSLINGDLKSSKSWASASDYRALMKSSETAPNKGFFAICSPNPFIKCYTVSITPTPLIRAKARARKTHNRI